MGYLYKGACFPDLPTVKAEQCASALSSWGSGGSAFTTECTQATFTDSDITMTMCRRENGGACFTYQQPFQQFPACAYDGSTSNQSELFALMLGFLAVIWCANRLRRMFWGNHEGV